MAPIVRVQSLVQNYGLKPVLTDVSFEVARGECLAIVGSNASGKTTLLDTLGGMIPFESGTVELFGLGRRSTVEDELTIRRRTCYLPIDPKTSDRTTVREHWLSTAMLWGRSGTDVFDEIAALAAMFELTDHLDASFKSLSSGQTKKVYVGGALLTNAELLLLDEPFSGGLDPTGIRSLQRILRHLADASDRTVIFSAPVPELIESIADRALVLVDGKIAAIGSPDELTKSVEDATSLSDAIVALVDDRASDAVDNYFQSIERTS